MVPVTGAALNPPGWETNNNSFKCTCLLQTMSSFPFYRDAWKTPTRSKDPVFTPDLPGHGHNARHFPASRTVRVPRLPACWVLHPTHFVPVTW